MPPFDVPRPCHSRHVGYVVGDTFSARLVCRGDVTRNGIRGTRQRIDVAAVDIQRPEDVDALDASYRVHQTPTIGDDAQPVAYVWVGRPDLRSGAEDAARAIKVARSLGYDLAEIVLSVDPGVSASASPPVSARFEVEFVATVTASALP